MRAGVGIGLGYSPVAESFPAVLSLQHKVLEIKGGIRNISMQLFDWVRGTSS